MNKDPTSRSIQKGGGCLAAFSSLRPQDPASMLFGCPKNLCERYANSIRVLHKFHVTYESSAYSRFQYLTCWGFP